MIIHRFVREYRWRAFQWKTGQRNLDRRLFFSNSLVVFPEHDLFVNLIFKNANSFLIKVLDDFINGPREFDAQALRSKVLAKVSDLPIKEVERLPQYEKSVVLRDPFARVLSAFLDRIGSGKRGMYTDIGGFGDLSQSGFKRFLLDLEGGLLKNDLHFTSQSSQMLFPLDAFSVVLKCENLEEDLVKWLKNRFPEAVHAESSFARADKMVNSHATGAGSKIGDFYDAEAEAIVRRQYAGDFLLLRQMTL